MSSERPPKPKLESILALDPSIRYVIMVDLGGRPLARVDKPGAPSLEPPEQTPVILQRFALARGLTTGADEFYGRMKTIIVLRERLTELLFPLAGELIIVGAETSFPLEKIAKIENRLTASRP